MRSPLASWVRRSRDTAPRGIPNQALQLIAPMGRDLGIGMQGKALHAGTAGTGERGRPRRPRQSLRQCAAPARQPHSPKAGAAAPRRPWYGPARRVITQGVIAGSRRRVEAHLQVAEVAQLTAVSSWDAAIQYRRGTGTDTTHWRVGPRGSPARPGGRRSAMRRPAHDGQNPRLCGNRISGDMRSSGICGVVRCPRGRPRALVRTLAF